MIHQGIYATPNSVVANKNRKTKSENLCDTLNELNNNKEELFSKLLKLLKEYLRDIKNVSHDDWYIKDANVAISKIDLIIGDRFGDEEFYSIPISWIDDKELYLYNYFAKQREKRKGILKKIIDGLEKNTKNNVLEIENYKKELKSLENQNE